MYVKSTIGQLSAAALICFGLFGGLGAPTAQAKDKFLDYEKVRKAVPEMGRLSDTGAKVNLTIQQKMEILTETDSEEKALAIRKELTPLLNEFLVAKTAMVELTKDVLGVHRSTLSDQEIFDKLTETTLQNVHWDNDQFKKCIRDISRALRIPIRLHYRVVQMNKVTFDFSRTRAEGVLNWICTGFDLRYLVYNGEIIIYKKMTPTEERFVAYQKKHPKVKLRYWDREQASGDYQNKEKTVTDDQAKANAKRWSVDSLDLGLLRENLLKIHIVEAGSERHNQRRIGQKSFEALTAPGEPSGNAEVDAANAAARKKLDWELRHYLLLELDGSIETIDILQRVLGKNLVSDPKAAAMRKFLRKSLPEIKWRNKDLTAALQDLAKKIGVPVEVSGIPPTTSLEIDMTLPKGCDVETAINFILGIHEMRWSFEKGALKFEYLNIPE